MEEGPGGGAEGDFPLLSGENSGAHNPGRRVTVCLHEESQSLSGRRAAAWADGGSA